MLQNSAAANEYVTYQQENCRRAVQNGVDGRKLSERNQSHEMNAAADAATSRGPGAGAVPPERLPLASQAETQASQREPEQQAVAQRAERRAWWRQQDSRASAQQRLAHRQPENLASASQRAYLPQGLSPQELERPEPLQQQPA
jgi:hypothetical protein